MRAAMRLFRGQAGYSLAELLVVCAVAGLVMAAAFVVLDVSQRTFTTSASLADAQVGARAGIDQMLGELRLIGASYSGVSGAGDAVTAASATSITFAGDVDGDTMTNDTDAVTASTATGTTVSLTAANGGFAVNESAYIASGATREVRPITGVAGVTLTLGVALSTSYAAGSNVRSVETVTYAWDASARTLNRTVGGVAATIVDNVVDFNLTYFDASNPPVQTTDRLQIREIEVRLGTEGTDGSRRLVTARVRPRSLGL